MLVLLLLVVFYYSVADTHSPWARSTLAARDLMLAGRLALGGRFFCRVERRVWAFLRLLATLKRLREFESNWEPLPSPGPAARTECKIAFQYKLRLLKGRTPKLYSLWDTCTYEWFWRAVSNRWTGLLEWITGSNQTASKSDDAFVAHWTTLAINGEPCTLFSRLSYVRMTLRGIRLYYTCSLAC